MFLGVDVNGVCGEVGDDLGTRYAVIDTIYDSGSEADAIGGFDVNGFRLNVERVFDGAWVGRIFVESNGDAVRDC